MKNIATEQRIVLSNEEKKRLVAYFNVLIEMDFELKKSYEEEEKNV